MLPHLEPVARALDELDEKYYLDFDTSEVPILMLYKQERDRYLLQEFQTGLISANEYREGSSRKEVEADLADSLLMNPNLIPIANTKKKMEENEAQMGGAPGMPGMPGMPPGMPGMPPGMPPGAAAPVPPLDPNTMQGAIAEAAAAPVGDIAQTTVPPEAFGASPQASVPPLPTTMAHESSEDIQTKNDSYEDKYQTSIERWTEILSRSLERVVERQQRVVMEKVGGSKSRKALMSGTLDIDAILPVDVWNKQMDEDIKPVISAIIHDSFEHRRGYASEKGLKVKSIPVVDVVKTVESQMAGLKKINEEIFSEMNELMMKSFSYSDEESRFASFRDGLVNLYSNFLVKEQNEIAENSTKSAWDFAQTV